MKSTLVDSAISHVAKRSTGKAFVFQTVSQAKAKRSLASNNAVTTPEIFVRSKQVHRTTFAFCRTSRLAKKLGHALIHVHPAG